MRDKGRQSPLEIKTTSKLSTKLYSTSQPRETTKIRGNPVLPSLGPLKLQVAAIVPPAEKPIVPDDASFIQHTWSTFSTMSDSQRNQLLRGLLTRSSSQQIEYICTCLNIKSLDDSAFTKVFPDTVVNKYLVTSRSKPSDFRPKEKTIVDTGKQKQEESFRDAMKRAFASDLPSLTDYIMSSENGSFMNANSYIKLLNSNMDPDQLTKQVSKAGPEGLRFLMNFLAKQCQKYQSTLKSLYEISHEIELEAAAKKLFRVMLDVTNARYGTIYSMSQTHIQVYMSNWPEIRSTNEHDIFAARVIGRGDMINVMNFRTSDYHTDRVEDNYQSVNPDCIISAPYFGDGMKVAGFVELIGKKDGNPIFTTEDEFLVQSLSSLTTILFNQISVKQSAQKKSNNIKAFLTTAHSMSTDTDMGDLITIIMNTTRDLVSADRCALFLLDKETNELWSKVAQGTGEIRFPANKGIAGHVVSTGEICNIADAYEDPRFNPDFDHRTGYHTKSILCVPMMSPDGQIIGAVQAINKLPDGFVFSNDDVAQLTSFATLSASTLQKSEEMNELSRLLNEEKCSSGYSKCILQSLNSVLITFDETGRVMTVENAHLLGLEDMVGTMRLTSFEHWLGRNNSQLSTDISHALLLGKKSMVSSYDFHLQGRKPIQIKYSVRKMTPDLQNRKKSFLEVNNGKGRRQSIRIPSSVRASMHIESLSQQMGGVPLGCLLVMEIAQPNHRMIEQVACQLPNEVVSLVQEIPEKSEGETTDVSVLVIDVRRFSVLMKNLSPEKLGILLNKFYEMVLETVNKFGGLMFEHSGDSAKIVFGAPQAIDDKEKVTVDCALALKKGIEELNRKCEEHAIPAIQVSIGISSGSAFCASLGPSKLKQYSVLGDPVVEAIQMENIAKVYGATIVAANNTKEVIKDQYHIREVDLVSKREFPTPTTIYEIVSASGSSDHDMMSTIICYELGLGEYRAKNWQAAIMHFKKAQTLTDDYPSKYMAERCRGIIDGRYDIPEEWEGVWDL